MIRTAAVADAAALFAIQQRSWIHAYASFIDVERMVAHAPEERLARWQARLTEASTTTWVWDQDGTVVGYVTIGAARDDDADASTGELHAIYVDPPAQGAGVGSRLLAAAVDALRAQGFTRATLWTFEANGLARRFYARRAWSVDPSGAAQEDWWAPAIRYEREL